VLTSELVSASVLESALALALVLASRWIYRGRHCHRVGWRRNQVAAAEHKSNLVIID